MPAGIRIEVEGGVFTCNDKGEHESEVFYRQRAELSKSDLKGISDQDIELLKSMLENALRKMNRDMERQHAGIGGKLDKKGKAW